jgi:AcrR family transcriptional regulator
MKKHAPPLPSGLSAKERILHTALHLFYGNGVRATGIDRVIAEAKVTKVTFYRHFPSKDQLIEAFLEKRHRLWIDWFSDSIARSLDAMSPDERRDAPLRPVLHAANELFETPAFRGCVFANTVAEFGASVPAIVSIASRHKKEVCGIIATLLPTSSKADDIAWAATLALDGAIVNAQTGAESKAAALDGLRLLLDALTHCLRTVRPGRPGKRGMAGHHRTAIVRR